jgi:hypothetical protein
MIPKAKTLRSVNALVICAVFVLFLAASAPHRVHHLLEHLPWSFDTGAAPVEVTLIDTVNHNYRPHDHSHHTHGSGTSPTADVGAHHDVDDQVDQSVTPEQAHPSQPDQTHDGASSANDCFVQSIANQAHLSLSQPFAFTYETVFFEPPVRRSEVSFANFNPAPFSQRAPPNV